MTHQSSLNWSQAASCHRASDDITHQSTLNWPHRLHCPQHGREALSIRARTHHVELDRKAVDWTVPTATHGETWSVVLHSVVLHLHHRSWGELKNLICSVRHVYSSNHSHLLHLLHLLHVCCSNHSTCIWILHHHLRCHPCLMKVRATRVEVGTCTRGMMCKRHEGDVVVAFVAYRPTIDTRLLGMRLARTQGHNVAHAVNLLTQRYWGHLRHACRSKGRWRASL